MLMILQESTSKTPVKLARVVKVSLVGYLWDVSGLGQLGHGNGMRTRLPSSTGTIRYGTTIYLDRKCIGPEEGRKDIFQRILNWDGTDQWSGSRRKRIREKEI